jgi:membrane protease YdiL (CAAX protease family)
MDSTQASSDDDTTPSVTNRSLLLPYVAPYLAYVAIATFSPDRISPELSYLLRLVAVTILLRWAWRWYVPLTGPRNPWASCAWGAGAGLLGIALWIVLLSPFVPADEPAWGGLAFGLRLAAAGLLVPLFEELFVRGYILRLAYQWDLRRKQGDPEALAAALDEMSVDGVPPGAWSVAAVVISTLVFMAGHQMVEWPAAIAFGLLMAGLWIWRGDLISCISAHAVANIALAFYVRATGQWGLW